MVDIFRFFSIFLCTRSVRSYFLVLDSMCVLDVQMGCNGVVVGLSSSIDAGVLGGVGEVGSSEFGECGYRGQMLFVLIFGAFLFVKGVGQECGCGVIYIHVIGHVEHKASIFL